MQDLSLSSVVTWWSLLSMEEGVRGWKGCLNILVLWEMGLAARQEGDAKANPGSCLRETPLVHSGCVWDVEKGSINLCDGWIIVHREWQGGGRGSTAGSEHRQVPAHLRPGRFVCPRVALFLKNVAIWTSFSTY